MVMFGYIIFFISLGCFFVGLFEVLKVFWLKYKICDFFIRHSLFLFIFAMPQRVLIESIMRIFSSAAIEFNYLIHEFKSWNLTEEASIPYFVIGMIVTLLIQISVFTIIVFALKLKNKIRGNLSRSKMRTLLEGLNLKSRIAAPFYFVHFLSLRMLISLMILLTP